MASKKQKLFIIFTMTLSLVLPSVIDHSRAADLIENIVPHSAETVQPLLIGANVPAIVIKQADGSPFDLNKSFAEKPTVLVFYRGGW